MLSSNKNLLKKDLETIKKMSKIVDNDSINQNKVVENINDLIAVQSRLKELVVKFNNFSLLINWI